MRPDRRRTMLASIAFIAASACGTEPRTGVQLITHRFTYSAVDTVRADFVNASSDRLFFGACDLIIERRVGTNWVSAPRFELCILSMYDLEPGQSLPKLWVLQQTSEPLAKGQYRLRQFYGAGEDRSLRSVTTAPFFVR